VTKINTIVDYCIVRKNIEISTVRIHIASLKNVSAAPPICDVTLI